MKFKPKLRSRVTGVNLLTLFLDPSYLSWQFCMLVQMWGGWRLTGKLLWCPFMPPNWLADAELDQTGLLGPCVIILDDQFRIFTSPVLTKIMSNKHNKVEVLLLFYLGYFLLLFLNLSKIPRVTFYWPTNNFVNEDFMFH